MVACMYHEACHTGVAMPDAQGAHGPEVPGSPQPEAEATRATLIYEGKRICFHTLVHLVKTGHATMRNYYKSEVKAPWQLRDWPQSRSVDLWFFSLYQSVAEAMPRLSAQAQQEIERSRTQGNDPLTWKWRKEVTFFAQELLPCSANALDGWGPDRPLIYLLPELVQSMVGNVIGLPQRWLNHASVNELWWSFVSSWHSREAQERQDHNMPTRPFS